MNRRTFLGSLAGGAAAFSASAAAKRPNIVIIMADDMGFSDIGCYGSEIDTPNINSLAQHGVHFTHMYNTARCCPTRAALMTGLYSHQAGVGHMVADNGIPGYRGFLNQNCVTIAEALKPAGYRTLMAGKWHVGETRPHWPRDRGFDRYYGLVNGGSNYFSIDPGRTLVRDDTPISAEGDNFYLTDAFTDNALRLMDDRASGQPFFLYLAYTAPHWPLHAREQEIRKYRGRYLAGWDALRASRHARMKKMGIVDPRWEITPRDPGVPAWESQKDKEWQAHRMAVYAAQIDRMDQNIGRVLAKLRETREVENTLVMFLADNGGCAEGIQPNFRNLDGKVKTAGGRIVRYGNLPSIEPGPGDTFQSYGTGWANASNTPFRLYKHWVHEGGISTPFIARWPAMQQKTGGLVPQVGHVIDLMPTCLDAAGAAYPKTHRDQEITPAEGTSLVSAIKGTAVKRPKPLFWEHEGNRAVHSGDWKLVSRHNETWELSNLAEDRTEMHNLAGHNAGRVKEMTGLYEAWAKRCGVVTPEELRNHRPPAS